MTNILKFPQPQTDESLGLDVAVKLAAYREQDNWPDALSDPSEQVRIYAYSILNCWDLAVNDTNAIIRSMAYDELNAYEAGLKDPDVNVRIACLQMLSLQRTMA